MTGGYEPKWMPLIEAIEHVQCVTGGSPAEAYAMLLPALRDRAIKSRRMGGGLFGGCGKIDPSEWYRDIAVYGDGTVIFGAHPMVPPDLGPPPRTDVELWRADVLKFWPKSIATLQDVSEHEQPVATELKIERPNGIPDSDWEIYRSAVRLRLGFDQRRGGVSDAARAVVSESPAKNIKTVRRQLHRVLSELRKNNSVLLN